MKAPRAPITLWGRLEPLHLHALFHRQPRYLLLALLLRALFWLRTPPPMYPLFKDSMDGITTIMMPSMWYAPCPIMGWILLLHRGRIGKSKIQCVLLEIHFYIQRIAVIVSLPFKETVSQPSFGTIHILITIRATSCPIQHHIRPIFLGLMASKWPWKGMMLWLVVYFLPST